MTDITEKEKIATPVQKNTRIDLSYKSESGSAYDTAILPGEINQATLDQITEYLIDGYQVIADQVGLPTPLEYLLNDMSAEPEDHVLTTLEAWESDIPNVEDLLTDKPATTDLTPTDLAICLSEAQWDYQSEQSRLGIPDEGPLMGL